MGAEWRKCGGGGDVTRAAKCQACFLSVSWKANALFLICDFEVVWLYVSQSAECECLLLYENKCCIFTTSIGYGIPDRVQISAEPRGLDDVVFSYKWIVVGAKTAKTRSQ